MKLWPGMTPAEKLLEMYNNKWGSNIDSVFRECCYWSCLLVKERKC